MGLQINSIVEGKSADPGRRAQSSYSYVESPKIQNPQNPKSPRSKIQNPPNPKSKIPQIQNPKSKIPKIQNPKSPKLGPHKDLLHNGPKSKISKIGQKSLDFGFWIGGFWISAPKSKIPKIQNPKSPRSKIQNPQNPNPKSKIPNPQNPKSPGF